MGLEGVFDRQRMELEGGADLGELGLGRLEQADPDERLAVVDAQVTLADLQLARSAHAVFVEGAVDDHHAILAPVRASETPVPPLVADPIAAAAAAPGVPDESTAYPMSVRRLDVCEGPRAVEHRRGGPAEALEGPFDWARR